MLRSRGIDTLVLAGTDLNICAGDTLHHAFALGYHVVGVADCLSCFSKHDRQHAQQLKEVGLYLIENHYGLVARSDEVIGIISRRR
jgi:nicotinamidase-related amidase